MDKICRADPFQDRLVLYIHKFKCLTIFWSIHSSHNQNGTVYLKERHSVLKLYWNYCQDLMKCQFSTLSSRGNQSRKMREKRETTQQHTEENEKMGLRNK